MSKPIGVVRLALLLGALPLPGTGCTGSIDGWMGPAGESSDPAGPDAPRDGEPDDRGREPSTIGTQVFALCDGAEEAPAPRLLRLLTRREYASTLESLLFLSDVDASSLPLEPRVRGYDNNAEASVVTSRHLDAYLKVSGPLVDRALREQRAQLVPCPSSDASCASTFVRTFGLRAFRRPLGEDEVARYVALFEPTLTEGDFAQGLALTMQAMLLSSSFLYRSEVGEQQPNGTFALTPYEVASALSYLYWGTMPDQALLEAAARDELGTAAQREAQARRLLADPRAKEQLAEFSLQWLRSDGVLNAFKDNAIYPAFSDSLRRAMLEEQRRFVTELALERNGKFSELFSASYVFANGELARFYGLDDAGDDFRKRPVTSESQRGGVLALGAVLAAHAHSNESSPIKRGLFVRDRLLCQELPPPPPSLDTTPPGLDPSLTTRARFAKHTADPACASCHRFIDGVGFGLEGFDGIGARRTVENGMPIDESGQLLGREGLHSQTDEPFRGVRELSALLAQSETAQSCFALQYYRYARGYQETTEDACSLHALQKRFGDSDDTVKELLVGLALLDSFTMRRGE